MLLSEHCFRFWLEKLFPYILNLAVQCLHGGQDFQTVAEMQASQWICVRERERERERGLEERNREWKRNWERWEGGMKSASQPNPPSPPPQHQIIHWAKFHEHCAQPNCIFIDNENLVVLTLTFSVRLCLTWYLAGPSLLRHGNASPGFFNSFTLNLIKPSNWIN